MPASARQRARHRKPTPVAELTQVAATGLGATAVFGGVIGGIAALAGPAGAADSNDFYRLRTCESSNNYRANTGNGYYGAYQFDQSTWRSNGFSGRPDQASPSTQDQAAALLQSRRGWQPWPVCSQKLGLTDDRASRSDARPSLGTYRPDFPGYILSTHVEKTQRHDVYVWQAQMLRRGWPITVDGFFGPQSAKVAHDFAIEKNLKGTLPGEVNHTVWYAAFHLPVS